MRFSEIKENDVINGEGISVSLWTQGCPHHCKGCFNHQTWDFRRGKLFLQEDLDYLISCLDRNGIKRNLSILGGEPLSIQNASMVFYITRLVKKQNPNRKIYVWTGYLFEDLLSKYSKEALESIDYIIDGRFVEEKKNLRLKLRGSSNQRVIDVKKSLEQEKIVLHHV